jgi:hypothetical protein
VICGNIVQNLEGKIMKSVGVSVIGGRDLKFYGLKLFGRKDIDE